MAQDKILNSRVKPRVVVIGSGFGGLTATRKLAKQAVDVILIDRENYHTFTPLLYQVAAAEISHGEIAYPVRRIFHKKRNVQFVMGNVGRIDFEKQIVHTADLPIAYDYLIVAIGSVSHTFNIAGVGKYTFPLKTVEQAIALRNHILSCFERASHESDEKIRRRLLSFIIVGGGPTGVEYAGALSELIKGPLKKDYRTIDFREIRIVLVEAADSLLMNLPPKLRAYTLKRLQSMGCDVRLKSMVGGVEKSRLRLKGGESLEAETIVWTAGVKGDPLAKEWGMPVGRGGQVAVKPTLQLPDYPNVYVIGDLAAVAENDIPLPMLAPVAMQEGEAAARNIGRQLKGEGPRPFKFNNPGVLATIGRNAAVAQFGPWLLTGYPAWVIWLGAHLFKLIGFRNRLLVMISWAWDYLFFERALRFIEPREKAVENSPDIATTFREPKRKEETSPI